MIESNRLTPTPFFPETATLPPEGERPYSEAAFREEALPYLEIIRSCEGIEEARRRLYLAISEARYEKDMEAESGDLELQFTNRDCSRALRGMLLETSDTKAGFSVMQALWDLAQGNPRPDLQPGFYAQMTHILRGIERRPSYQVVSGMDLPASLSGRDAALLRSAQLDVLAERMAQTMAKYPDGLAEDAIARREARKQKILSILGGTEDDWANWKWHLRHVIKDPDLLNNLVYLRPEELRAAKEAVHYKLPFAITPYYASLMDDDPEAGRDRVVRAQVLPPRNYVEAMADRSKGGPETFDFMQERDTSPIDLVTRRYPNIVILKPYNTCPQICVYCQRNWEIDEAMSPRALASWDKIEAACAWIEQHPAICEVLITGGDPLTLADATLGRILGRLARIPHIDLVRIGTRIPATLPQRIKRKLASTLSAFRKVGRRDIALVTHVEHAYEITPEMAEAVDLLRRKGITVYNQLVYTFFASRRFESAKLRLLLRRIGIDPYYTFVPKGKEETADYRVPIARIMQEAKEEVRLLPGMRRTDAPVYNVPRLGKNHLRAMQHRDLISVLPDGSRVYEFHPWEKNVAQRESYVGTDVPILHYLNRLAAIGENPADYESIWYYF